MWLETTGILFGGLNSFSGVSFVSPLLIALTVSLQVQALSCASKFEAELKAEQDERKAGGREGRSLKAAFQELKATFSA